MGRLSECHTYIIEVVSGRSRSGLQPPIVDVNIDCSPEAMRGETPNGGTIVQRVAASFDGCGVGAVLRTTIGPPTHWKRFAGLMSWLEVTRTSAKWWASVGPGHFVAIQVPITNAQEPLFALCMAIDGNTPFHAVFCDPTQCKQWGCPVQSTETRFEHEVEGAAGQTDGCPLRVCQ
jgi:hypothetical protein